MQNNCKVCKKVKQVLSDIIVIVVGGSSVKWVFLHVQGINISLCWPDLAPLDGLWHGCVRARLADAVSKLRPRGVKCRCRGRCIGPVTDLSLFIRKSKTNNWKQKQTNKHITGSHSQATDQPWGRSLHSDRLYLRQLWMKVRESDKFDTNNEEKI